MIACTLQESVGQLVIRFKACTIDPLESCVSRPLRTRAQRASWIELETGITTHALRGSVNGAIGLRCLDTISASTLIGDALGFVLARLPADVTTRHLAADSVIFGILYTTCYTRNADINRTLCIDTASHFQSAFKPTNYPNYSTTLHIAMQPAQTSTSSRTYHHTR